MFSKCRHSAWPWEGPQMDLWSVDYCSAKGSIGEGATNSFNIPGLVSAFVRHRHGLYVSLVIVNDRRSEPKNNFRFGIWALWSERWTGSERRVKLRADGGLRAILENLAALSYPEQSLIWPSSPTLVLLWSHCYGICTHTHSNTETVCVD